MNSQVNRRRVVVSSLSITLKDLFSDLDWLVSITVAPLIFATVGLILIQGGANTSLASAAILGSGIAGMWGTTLFGAGDSLGRERRTGTLEYIMVVPAELVDIVIGKSLAYALVGLLVMSEVLVAAVFLFGLPVGIPNPLEFLIAFLSTIISFSILGLFLGSFFVLTREASAISNTLEGFVFAVCGIMYPVSVLPSWVQVISYSIPATWGMVSLRFSLTGGLYSTDFLMSVAFLWSVSLAYFLAAQILFKIVEYRVRIKGDMSSY